MSNVIQAKDMDHHFINEALRYTEDCVIEGCLGQRFIAAGRCFVSSSSLQTVFLSLNKDNLTTVRGNAQDAVGDTMNDGTITVHGNIGDAAGYAMRGGKIYVKGNAGYRAGIHMKEYKEKVPVMVIGGRAGSFLGEYQAGGIIIVLNMEHPEDKIVGNFPCAGMHGGKLLLRSDCKNVVFPAQVTARPAKSKDLEGIREIIAEYCGIFGYNTEDVLSGPFTVITPDSSNPYKQMYVAN